MDLSHHALVVLNERRLRLNPREMNTPGVLHLAPTLVICPVVLLSLLLVRFHEVLTPVVPPIAVLLASLVVMTLLVAAVSRMAPGMVRAAACCDDLLRCCCWDCCWSD
jgi:hypothetical protein